MPFSFSITRAGFLFIVSVSLVSVAAIQSGNNLLLLILSALLAAVLVSGMLGRAFLRTLAVSIGVPENVFVGERVAVKVSLENRKRRLPALSIEVEDLAPEKSRGFLARLRRLGARRAPGVAPEFSDGAVLRHTAFFPFVPASATRSALVFQEFTRRGLYRVEGFRISTRAPFGLFRRGERMPAEGEICVYPSVRDISSSYHLLPFLAGDQDGARPGHGESLASIRRYRDGESARLVDWKATAKTGEIMAREYAIEEENKLCLVLDTFAGDPPEGAALERFEKAVSMAAGLAAHFTEEGAELEFLSPVEHLPGGRGREQLYRILRSLALVQHTGGRSTGTQDLAGRLAHAADAAQLERILSDKVFKIILTAEPREALPASIHRSSRVLRFEEL